MASRGGGRRGRPRGASQAPPVFHQQAFAEALRITIAAIAHASAAGSQGGPSNLQRFRAHHPPIFTGGEDLMVVDHWFRQIEKVSEAIDITSDTVTTPKPDPTRKASPNRNPETPNLFLLVIILLNFIFKSVATQIPGPTRMADPNRSPVYSDVFIYLIKTFLLIHLVAETVSVLGQAHNHLQI